MRRLAALVRCRHLTILFAMLLVGCATARQAPPPAPAQPLPTLFPTIAAIRPPDTTPLVPDPSPVPDSGWSAGEGGIAIRRMQLAGDSGRPSAPLFIARIDPAAVRLRVVYDPHHPRVIRRWFADEHPLLAVNGGFFTEQYQSTALVVSNGVASGATYEGFGGMLAVTADGSVSLRALRDQPYDPDEPLDQAMQSFPMLIFPGGAPAEIEEDGRRARRSALALDRDGNLLVIVSPTAAFTLRGLADWLSRSDLNIERALNLDGGSSTGLMLKAGALDEQIDSLGPLPLVLLVESK